MIGVNPAAESVEVVGTILRGLEPAHRRARDPHPGLLPGPHHDPARLPRSRAHRSISSSSRSPARRRPIAASASTWRCCARVASGCSSTIAARDVPWAGDQVMYFETGQGSALSAGAHHGVDQLTLEARAYGVARALDPFLVNSVVGFIGPEYLFDERQIIRAGLEDHFMGKLLGLPMGVDVCYTNHAAADQNSADNLLMLLTAAGLQLLHGGPLLRRRDAQLPVDQLP